MLDTERPAAIGLDLDESTRRALWNQVGAIIEDYIADLRGLPVAPNCTPSKVRATLEWLDPAAPMAPDEAMRIVTNCMRDQQLHAGHPSYFGLFVPPASAMGVLAEALAAAFNPQLASWSHAPFGVEAEAWVLRALATRLGFPALECEGTLTSGGSEANLTALLVALHNACPSVARDGLGGLYAWPAFYVSAEAHHSWRKAARVAGLGDAAVRTVDCDGDFRMNVAALRRMLREDRMKGLKPFMVVATVGTTACGAIDPLRELRQTADAEDLWLHVDGAWGAAAGLSDRHRHVTDGITSADSLTLDAHKWLTVPMGAGMYLSSHAGGLRSVFATQPDYVPRSSDVEAVPEPYQESIQWSRRFNGLKILLQLVTSGWTGVSEMIDSSFAIGAVLKMELRHRGWHVVNQTPLPLACFRDALGANASESHRAIAASVNRRGKAWISTVELSGVGVALRACICNHRTTTNDIELLLRELELARVT